MSDIVGLGVEGDSPLGSTKKINTLHVPSKSATPRKIEEVAPGLATASALSRCHALSWLDSMGPAASRLAPALRLTAPSRGSSQGRA